MIVEPDLMQHWKFRLLARAIGKGEAFQALLGLWGHAQARRQWIFRLDAATLAAICDSDCGDEKLWQLMIHERTGWLVPRGGGWWEVRSWADLNRTLIHAWTVKSAGRLPWMAEYEKEVPVEERCGVELPPVPAPRKPSPPASASAEGSADPSADASPDGSKRREENRKEESESESDSPWARMVQERAGEEETKANTHPLCTLEEAIEQGRQLDMGKDAVKVWWHHRNATGWSKSGGEGTRPMRIHCWKSDLAVSKTWTEDRARKEAYARRERMRL